MTAFNISRPRGDTIRLLIEASRPDEDGVSQSIDLTEVAELIFTAKLSKDDADDDATTIQKTLGNGVSILDALEGLALVTIDPADTNSLARKTTYFCDVELIESDGTVTTIAEGKLAITLDVTRM